MLHIELTRLVGGSHQRPRGDVLEAQLFTFRLVPVELCGCDILRHREVMIGGPQVLTCKAIEHLGFRVVHQNQELLTEGYDIHIMRTKVMHGLHYFILGLSQPQHNRALGK